MSFKCISYLEHWGPFCSAELNHLCIIGRRHHEEQFCEIILNLNQWFRKMSFKVISYLALWWPLLQRSGTICAILVEGIMQEEQFCEITQIFQGKYMHYQNQQRKKFKIKFQVLLKFAQILLN